ncbi:hypothetical protein SASPL_144530 [Salvia splendens]|uniref:Uncharacterized protein n=1 Tax=Salvia splendens TaxID=180675 RepID=A0A8X8WH52_SALSN|nr:hypothetical protein SASPL_144530 [Salvia splendens]
MVDHYDPGFFGVRLANREQRAKWDKLVHLKVIPSRYPDEEALEALGLGDCFWELSRRCKINTKQWEAMKDKGEMFLSIEVLKSIEFVMVNSIQQRFFFQEEGDYFPLPNPSYTDVNGWHFTQNWRLNTKAHEAIMKATPFRVPLTWPDPALLQPRTAHMAGPFQSNPQQLTRLDPALPAPPQEEHAHDDDNDVSLAKRVDHLGTRIDRVKASMHQRFGQLNQRFDHYHLVNEERWDRVENMIDEMMRRFQRRDLDGTHVQDIGQCEAQVADAGGFGGERGDGWQRGRESQR